MGQESEAVSITATVGQLVTGATTIVTLKFTNTGSSTVFLGTDNSVTASDGFPILIGEEMKVNDYIGDWYAICDTGESSTIRVDMESV